MPVTTDNMYNIKRLNVIFAVCTVLTLFVMLWMLWHDYDRPWRHTQNEYFNLRSALAHFEILAYDSDAEREKRSRLVEALRSAEAELSTEAARVREAELLARAREVGGKLQGASLNYSNLNAELQVIAFRYEEAKTLHGEDHPKTRDVKAEQKRKAERLAEFKARQDVLDDELRLIKRDIKKLGRKRETARKALAAYDKRLNDARRQDDMYRPGAVSHVSSLIRNAFNLPGLDFAPPKGVAGRHEVRQVFMPSIRFDFNFLDSYVTDRCITCHVGVDDPNLTAAHFVDVAATALTNRQVADVLREENTALRIDLLARLGRAGDDALLERVVGTGNPGRAGEEQREARAKYVLQIVDSANAFLRAVERPPLEGRALAARLSQDAALTREKVIDAIITAFMKVLTAAPPTGPDGRPLAFEEMTKRQQDDHLQSLVAAMNTYLEQQGRPRIAVRQPLLAHPDLDLYVGIDSPHPIKTMGCTVCHEGSGQDTDFVLAAHTPKNHEEEREWMEKHYVRELGVPLATFHLVEEYWERPMLLPDYTSASCRKCHAQAFDIERHRTELLESASRLVEGRQLFTKVGCINCHNVGGLSDSMRVGAALTYVSDKLTEGFMQRWIGYPNNFRPSTRMPHFFGQENNLQSSANELDPNPILRNQVEIQAMTHYLRTFSRPFEPRPLPEGLTGDPGRGETLFVQVGCLACHVNLDAPDPLDAEGRSFGRRWITGDLVHGEDLSAEEAGARYEALSKNERARYAMRRLTPKRRRQAKRIADEEILAADLEGRDPDPAKTYVPAAFTRFAPELSGMGTKLVPDPDDPEQVRHGLRWLYSWLAEPRHYSSYTKMPRLFRENYYWSLEPAKRARHTQQDILDIATYMLTLRNDAFDAMPFPEDAAHESERQRLILMLLGGQNTAGAAKKILQDEKADPADPYGRLSGAIVSQTYRSFGGGAEGRSQAAAFIAARSRSLKDRQKLYLGMKMISHYGCYTCHEITGFEDASRPGTDLSLWGEKFMSQLDFAFFAPAFREEIARQPEVFGNLYIDDPEYAHLIRDADGNRPQEILHNRGAFAYHKLRNPRIWDRSKIKKPYEKLKMPNFFFTDEEARSLVTYLLSRRKPNVAEALRIDYETTALGQIAKGRALVRQLNCTGCHSIEGIVGHEATIHQYYTDDRSMDDSFPFGPRYMPPLLWGEGAKIQYDWLFSFLNNVEMLRPWLHVRMPSFNLTPSDATTLVEYFAGLSRHESGTLHEALAPVVQRLRRAHGGAANADGNAPTNDAWFLTEKFADEAAFLARYGLNHKQVRPYDFDTTGATDTAQIADILAPTYEKVVARGTFLSDLFNVAFPYSDTRLHGADDAAFALGEALFFNQRCLACHVAGDPTVPGTTTDIKAPNFALTSRRLRYDWVVNWLQDPQAIQPGANMPQVFQDRGSAFASLPAEQREALEARFGKTPQEQIKLLVDYLFELGNRGHTAIQPGGLQVQSEETGDQEEMEIDMEEFEDEFEDEFGDDTAGEAAPEKTFDEEAFEP